MHLLITAMSADTGSSEYCRHARNLAFCAASRKEVLRITVVIGKWQKFYFDKTFTMKDKKIAVLPVDITNDALSRNLWYLHSLPALASRIAADVVHLSFPAPVGRRFLRCPVVLSF